jgi:hypothetical protein
MTSPAHIAALEVILSKRIRRCELLNEQLKMVMQAEARNADSRSDEITTELALRAEEIETELIRIELEKAKT